jgi:RNA polymerase sigma factor (sigma-70 family)
VSDWQVFRLQDHQSLVRYFVNRYAWVTWSGRVSEDDLWQVGNMGLLHAISKFDPSRGWKFQTYARRWVQNYMQRLTETSSYAVYYPTHFLWQQPEAARDRKWSVSLDSTRRSPEGDDLTPLKDTIRDRAESVESALLVEERRQMMAELADQTLRLVGERSALILRRRAAGETLEAIGKDIGVTRERVRQIEAEALKKCRSMPLARQAKQVLESA